MTEQMPSPPSIEISDSQYQKIGLQCISPGIAPGTLDDERLQTFNKSKFIAMQQKRQIRRMNLDAIVDDPDSEQEVHPDAEEGEEDAAARHPEDKSLNTVHVINKACGNSNNNSNVSDLTGDKTSVSVSIDDVDPSVGTPATDTSINTTKSQSKSLKRNNIPKPLSLNVPSKTRHGPFPDVRSAPPMVTRYPISGSNSTSTENSAGRVSKPRVIYKGRSVNRPFLGPMPLFQTSSPIVPRHLMRPQNAPMTAHPTGAPRTQRSFEQFITNPVRAAANSVTRDVFKDESTKIAPLSVQPKSTRREFFDTIEIEDHSNNVVIEGDIRLMMENFQFQFDSMDPQTDKKLFLSICSKIWNDVVSRE
ncbi:unnamed protein product [Kluyveromyces dobzhanskii CBS 2104]|uniref:WGS project CCBQ000000000 data, contig 00102 n=1 Tax=Kluyveromyces dobzhanskii CBS 2104 TaxID=1427455 RepID=A0A0A8L4K8_9SACH|nr:unnamed protein product [Kluyveromyces dobzhanskii CBS 2104]